MTVKPKDDIVASTYFNELLDRLNQDEKLTCTSYEMNENEMKIKIDSKDNGTYFISLSMNTYDGIEQLMIYLEPQRISEQFNSELHRIKILTKNTLCKDWEKCIWLYDEQSIDFAENLYGKMYRVENQLRSLINQIMITYVGIEWWEKFSPMQLKETYSSRVRGYKTLTTDFKDVEDRLMAIDTNHLKVIMTHTVKKWEPIYNAEVESLLELDHQSNYGRIIALLKKQLKNERNLWDTLFKDYFEPSSLFEEEPVQEGEFLQIWGEYCDNRNHIAHNKLLDIHAYEKILANVVKVGELIQKARDRFERSTVTDQERDVANQLMLELQLEQQMYEAANVKVYSESRIKDMMQEVLYDYALQIRDELEERDDIEITIHQNPELDMFSNLCEITSNVDETSLFIRAMFSDLSGTAGDESKVISQLVDNDGNVLDQAELMWVNGDARWSSEDGYYVATQTEELRKDEMDDFVEVVVSKVHELIRNYYKELVYMHEQSIRDGGSDPICDEACDNCGDMSVSIDESILTCGKCAKCGFENDISECLRCGNLHIGTGPFCESCHTFIDSQ